MFSAMRSAKAEIITATFASRLICRSYKAVDG
jgi:hypothetical protein